jgi:colicin import membrane protein
MSIAPTLSVSGRPEFCPPPNARSWKALALALAAHLLLVIALTWGVSWKSSDEAAAFSAELWTGQPQQATPPDQPTPKPAPAPEPAPPQPAPLPPPPKVEAPTPDADIALEQEKKRALLRKQQAAEELADQKAADLAEKKQAKLKEDQARLKKEQAAELAADKAEAAQLKAQKAAQEAKEAAKEAQRKQEQQKQATAAAKAQRDANLARLNAQLGSAGGGGGNPKGVAAQGNGGSSTYGAIVKAAIKPNVVFTDEIVGNPMAKIEVRLTLDGTIISQRLVSSSGNKAWDEAAMNGITRTRVMPRDVDGRIPDTTLILEMRPKN